MDGWRRWDLIKQPYKMKCPPSPAGLFFETSIGGIIREPEIYQIKSNHIFGNLFGALDYSSLLVLQFQSGRRRRGPGKATPGCLCVWCEGAQRQNLHAASTEQ